MFGAEGLNLIKKRSKLARDKILDDHPPKKIKSDTIPEKQPQIALSSQKKPSSPFTVVSNTDTDRTLNESEKQEFKLMTNLSIDSIKMEEVKPEVTYKSIVQSPLVPQIAQKRASPVM